MIALLILVMVDDLRVETVVASLLLLLRVDPQILECRLELIEQLTLERSQVLLRGTSPV